MAVADGKVIVAGIVHVPLPDIDPNPYQPRAWPREEVERLARSIEENGLAQVPTGRRAGERIQIGAGHGRVEAYRLLLEEGKTAFATIPMNLQDLDDEAMAIMALVENLERRELTPMETARAARRFLEAFSWTQTALAQKLGMSQPNLSNLVRVLALPEYLVARVDKGDLPWTVARELLVLQGFEPMMKEALDAAARWGSLTRERMCQAIHQTVLHEWRRLYSVQGYVGERDQGNPQFDYKRACHDCEHMRFVSVVDALGGRRGPEEYCEFCTNPECWDKRNREAIEKRDAAARQRAERSVRRSIQEKVESQGYSPGIVQADLPAGVREPVTAKDREMEGVAIELEQLAASEPVSEIPERLRPISIQEATKIFREQSKSEWGHPDEITEHFLRDIDKPEECTTTCTKGFHVVYDPQRPKASPRQVCCNQKCHRGKRAAFARARNKVNDLKIAAEKKGIADAVARCISLGHLELQVLLRALHFRHVGYGGSTSLTLTNDKATRDLFQDVNVPWPENYLRIEALYRAFIDLVARQNVEWLSRKIMEAALNNLKHHGDRTDWKGWVTEDLANMGVDVSALRGGTGDVVESV